MQIVIDIDEKTYGCVKYGIDFDDTQVLRRAILNGTPIPDNATNGDVIKAMFGEVAYLLIKKTMGEYDWWNAPYQKGGKE